MQLAFKQLQCLPPPAQAGCEHSCRCPHLQIEGRGNGIKTNVVNNVDIAKALERPPECEQGLLVTFSQVHH
jgi:hypothetical protein